MGPISTIQRAIGGGLLAVVMVMGLWSARLEYLRAGYKADLIACRSARQLDHANAATVAAKAEAGFARAEVTAATTYADRLAAREPIILQSTNTVREYAQTSAGRVLCRGADRVRAIDDLDTRLAAIAGPSGSGSAAVPADTAASPAGR